MITYRKLLESIRESTGVIAKFDYLGETIEIKENFNAYVDGQLICSSNSLEESKSLVKTYIDNHKIELSEDKIVEKMSLFLDNENITSNLVEFYKQKIENNEFFIDEIITSLKTVNTFGKYEYELKDGSVISIDEETQLMLQTILKNKYDIADYMCESVDSFKQVMRDIRSN